jgi:hypothetical protein
MTLASRRKSIKWANDLKGSSNPNFKGGKYIDDKGYIRVLAPDHPFENHGYIYEHRLVAEKYLGRYLQSWETVHHINEIKIDNRWSNFYLTTVPEHSAIHREGKRKSPEAKSKLRKGAKDRMKNGRRDKSGKFGPTPDVVNSGTDMEGDGE